MIHTVYSNSYEVLRAVLLHNVEALGVDGGIDDKTSPDALFAKAFEKVPVIVPNRAVGHDLTKSIAARDGVCAGIDFMLLSAWMGFFSKEPMANILGNEADWMIWQILREEGPQSFRAQPGHEPLANYLEGKNDDDIWRLVRHITQTFVVYATYRLDWVMDWLGLHPTLLPNGDEGKREKEKLEKHPDFVWQRDLLRLLAEHPAWRGRQFLEDYPDMLRRLAESQAQPEVSLANGYTVKLPQVLHVFAPFVVPPLMLPILKAFALSGRDVWFYLLNPTSEYWFDLVPQRLFNWEAKGGEMSDDSHHEVGHPILANNGRSTRANIDRLWRYTAAPDTGVQLTELDLPEGQAPAVAQQRHFLASFAGRLQDQRLQPDTTVENQSYYLESRDPRLLRRIQDSILNLNPDLKLTADGTPLFDPEDRSLQFMRAPTATRELEALLDWLQARFREDPSLRPDDVLIVTPDLSATAPLMEKVFESQPADARIEWRISGLSYLDGDQAAQAVLGLGKLLTGRATRESLMAWISLPPVASKFGLTSDDMPTIEMWLRTAGYRYGLSDAHLNTLDPVTFAVAKDMTLARAIERLTLGFCLPNDVSTPLFDTLPVVGTEERGWTSVGDRPVLLDALARLSSYLEAFRTRIVEVSTASEWMAWLMDAMTLLFKEEGNGFNRVRQAAAAVREDIERASFGETPMAVPFDLFMSSVESQLEMAPGGGLPSNRVTLTGMAQLRPLPYRIIAIVGLNDDCSFPGTMRRHEFDLMAVAPRRGDRDSRVDNRNVFLDLLLAARDRFLISYVCGTGEAANERQPSIVAQELRDWLLDFTDNRDERRQVAEQLTVTVPLNAFSQSNFMYGNRDWRSHDARLFEAVQKAMASDYSEADPVFADTGLKDQPMQTVTLRALVDFWKKPSTRTLGAAGIWLEAQDEGATEGLLPEETGLGRWKRRHDAYQAFLAGCTTEAWDTCVKANPLYGAQGVREWYGEADTAFGQALFQYHQTLAVDTPVDDIDVDLDLGNDMPHLLARLKGIYVKEDRRRLVRLSASKSSSLSILRELLTYLVACAANEINEAWLVCVWDKNLQKLMKKEEADAHGLVCLQLPACDATLAKDFLRLFMIPYLARSQSPLIGTDFNGQRFSQSGTPDQRADQILWRGRHLEEAQTITYEREKALSSMLPNFVRGNAPGAYDAVKIDLAALLRFAMLEENRDLTLPNDFCLPTQEVPTEAAK